MNEYGIEPAEVMGKKHPLFKALTYVAAARADDSHRNLNCVRIEKNDLVYTMVATNGKRLHTQEFDPGMLDGDFDDIATGNYEIISISAKHIVLARMPEDKQHYPSWRKIIPTAEDFREIIISSKTISRLGIQTGCLLATDYAQEACGFGCGRKKDDQATIEYSIISPDEPFMIKHDLGTAIVMPMRMDNPTPSCRADEDDEDNDEIPDESTLTPEFAGLDSDNEPEPTKA